CGLRAWVGPRWAYRGGTEGARGRARTRRADRGGPGSAQHRARGLTSPLGETCRFVGASDQSAAAPTKPASPLLLLRRLPRTLLPDPQVDPDRATHEPEPFPQFSLQEAPIARLQEPRGEQHHRRWPRGRLRGEQNLRLLAAPNRRRGRGDELGQPPVELPGRHPLIP